MSTNSPKGPSDVGIQAALASVELLARLETAGHDRVDALAEFIVAFRTLNPVRQECFRQACRGAGLFPVLERLFGRFLPSPSGFPEHKLSEPESNESKDLPLNLLRYVAQVTTVQRQSELFDTYIDAYAYHLSRLGRRRANLWLIWMLFCAVVGRLRDSAAELIPFSIPHKQNNVP